MSDQVPSPEPQASPDRWHNIVKVAGSYNRYLLLGVVLFTSFAIWLVGCSPKTLSITTPGKEVGRTELLQEVSREEARLHAQEQDLKAEQVSINAEFEAKVAKHNNEVQSLAERKEIGLKHIDEQVATRQKVVNIMGVVANEALNQAGSGGLNPIGLLTTLLGAAGIAGGGGMLLDSKRRKKLVTKLEPQQPPDETA